MVCPSVSHLPRAAVALLRVPGHPTHSGLLFAEAPHLGPTVFCGLLLALRKLFCFIETITLLTFKVLKIKDGEDFSSLHFIL